MASVQNSQHTGDLPSHRNRSLPGIGTNDPNGALSKAQLDATSRSNSNASETPYTTVHYHRHLGPTALAPGHKRIALKVRQDDNLNTENAASSGIGTQPSLSREVSDIKENLALFEPDTGESISRIYLVAKSLHFL